MNWYTHYIGDYLKDTMHLSLTEEGVYRRLLDNYYATEKPIPADIQQVFNICRTKTGSDRKAVSSVLGQFFDHTDDGYLHGRVEKELSRSKYISDKRAKAGSWDRNKCSTNKPTNDKQSDNTCSTISLSLSKPPKVPLENLASQSLTAVEVAVAICSANGITGFKERQALADAIRLESEVTKRIDLPQIGEEAMAAWLKHQQTGKFPQLLMTFLESGLHKVNSSKKRKATVNPADIIRQQEAEG